MKPIENLIIDMDGVLWRGETAMPGLARFFEVMATQQVNFMLATNNAGKTPAQYVAKFAKFGITISPDRVMTSALATAVYLEENYTPSQTAVYMIGDDGLREALKAKGFSILARDDMTNTAQVVTVGLTTDVTYHDFAAATVHLHRGAAFIGCNPDTSFPHELGLLPGNGSLLALLKAATDLEPTIIGKPKPIIFQTCLKQLGDGANGRNTAMLGDRLNTDIAGGKEAGLQTILVLSGVTQPDDLESSPLKPDYVFANIGELAEKLNTL